MFKSKKLLVSLIALFVVSTFFVIGFMSKELSINSSNFSVSPQIVNNFIRIEKNKYPIRDINIAPSSILPAKVAGVEYKLKDGVNIIPDNVILVNESETGSSYKVTDDFNFNKNQVYIDKKNNVAFKVLDISEDSYEIKKVQNFSKSNKVPLDELIETLTIPKQLVLLNSANVDPSTVLPHVIINHDAQPSEEVKRKSVEMRLKYGYYNVPTSYEIEKLKGLSSSSPTDKFTGSNKMKTKSSTDSISLNQGYGYVEAFINEFHLGEFLVETGVIKDKEDVDVVIDGSVALYSPTIIPYYEFGEKLGAKFVTGEEINLNIIGGIKLEKEVKVPLYAFNVDVEDIGEIGAGIFLTIKFDGNANVQFSINQEFKFKAGAEVGFKWLVIPTGLTLDNSFDPEFDCNAYVNLEGRALAGLGPAVYLDLFGFNILSVDAQIGAALEAKVKSGNEDSKQAINLDIYAYGKANGSIVGKGFTIVDESWHLFSKEETYTAEFKVEIEDADAYLNMVKGSIFLMDNATKLPYDGPYKVIVNGEDNNHIGVCDSKGFFRYEGIQLKNGDTISIKLDKDSAFNHAEKILNREISSVTSLYSDSVEASMHFDEIIIKRVDFFNDIIEAYIPHYYDGDDKVLYTGPIEVIHNHNKPVVVALPGGFFQNNDTNQPLLTSGLTVGYNPLVNLTNKISSSILGKLSYETTILPKDTVLLKANISGFEISSKLTESGSPLVIDAMHSSDISIIYDKDELNLVPANMEKAIVKRSIKGVITNNEGNKPYSGYVELISGLYDPHYHMFEEFPIKIKIAVKEIPNTSSCDFMYEVTKEYTKEEFLEFYYHPFCHDISSITFSYEGYDDYDFYAFDDKCSQEHVNEKIASFSSANLLKDKVLYTTDSKINKISNVNMLQNIINSKNRTETQMVKRSLNSFTSLEPSLSFNNSSSVKKISKISTVNNIKSLQSYVITIINNNKVFTKQIIIDNGVSKVDMSLYQSNFTIESNLNTGLISYSSLSNNVDHSCLNNHYINIIECDFIVKGNDCDVNQVDKYYYYDSDGYIVVSISKISNLPVSVVKYSADDKIQYEVLYSNYKFKNINMFEKSKKELIIAPNSKKNINR